MPICLLLHKKQCHILEEVLLFFLYTPTLEGFVMNSVKKYRSSHTVHIVFLLFLCAFALAACAVLPSGKGGLSDASTPVISEAREFWANGNLTQAESLYAQAVKGSLPTDEEIEAWSRLTLIAVREGRSADALARLEEWNKVVPNANANAAWQDVWYTVVSNLPPSQAITQAEALWKNKAYSTAARTQAALILLGRAWDIHRCVAALPSFSAYYDSQDAERKKLLEQRVSEELPYMAGPTLASLGQKLAPENTLIFPAPNILLELVRRGLNVGGIDNTQLLSRLTAHGVFADAELPQKVLSQQHNAAQHSAQAGSFQSVCLVLALPMSGPVQPIADKIRAGAMAAKTELAALGTDIQLYNVDTTQADWISQLDSLPAQCAVVGGPIQTPLYSAAKKAQITSRRNFFAFLPQLEGQDEGTVAWRFFPSPQDQVNALLGFTRELGINSYGAFYPSDTYGTRMTAIFSDTAQSLGSSVTSASYPLGDMTAWTSAAAGLLHPQRVNDVPLSTAEFGAVFLPDAWKNMDMVTTALIYNGDDKQVLMGTTLWEQSLMNGVSTVNTANYSLAVFPAAWNPAQTPAALLNAQTPVAANATTTTSTTHAGKPNFWMGLGYDFVRLGSSLGRQNVASSIELNSALMTAHNIQWSMAPMAWNGGGQASQRLFLFSPTIHGITLADVNTFRKNLENARTRFENRRRAARKSKN